MQTSAMHWAVYATVDDEQIMMASFYVRSDADDYKGRLSDSGWNAWVESLDD